MLTLFHGLALFSLGITRVCGGSGLGPGSRDRPRSRAQETSKPLDLRRRVSRRFGVAPPFHTDARRTGQPWVPPGRELKPPPRPHQPPLALGWGLTTPSPEVDLSCCLSAQSGDLTGTEKTQPQVCRSQSGKRGPGTSEWKVPGGTPKVGRKQWLREQEGPSSATLHH